MNRYLRAISTNFVFFVINTLFFLVMTPISIRVMGADFYGLWSILIAIALFSNIGALGIESIINKFSAESKQEITDYPNKVLTSGFIIVLIMALTVMFLMLIMRSLIAKNIQTSPDLQMDFSKAIFWIALSLFPQFLTKVTQGYFLSQYENKLVRIMDSLSSLLPWIGAVCITFFEKNLYKVAEWFFLAQMVVFLTYIIILRRKVSYHIVFDCSLLRKMINFSGYMFIESTAISFFQQFDRVIVGFVLGPVFAGVYSVGTSFALRLSQISGQATEVMIPYASLKNSLNDHVRLYTVFRKLSQYVSLIMAGMGGLLVLWMDELLSLWISPSYAAAYANPFRLLIIAYGLISLSRPAHQTLTGLGKVKFTSLIYLSSSVAMLASVYLFSYRFGILGAACANIIMVLLLVYNLYTYNILAHGIPWKSVLSDLRGGLFIPFVFYGLLLFNQAILFRLLLSAILGLTFLIDVLKDDWARTRLFHRGKTIVP